MYADKSLINFKESLLPKDIVNLIFDYERNIKLSLEDELLTLTDKSPLPEYIRKIILDYEKCIDLSKNLFIHCDYLEDIIADSFTYNERKKMLTGFKIGDDSDMRNFLSINISSYLPFISTNTGSNNNVSFYKIIHEKTFGYILYISLLNDIF